MKDDHDLLLTSNQLARACGISRSTVLRLEERGQIKPVNRSYDTSSRQYDISALYQTSLLLKLKQFGIVPKQGSFFEGSKTDYNELKAFISKRIDELSILITVLNSYTDPSNHLEIKRSIRSGFIAYTEPVTLSRNWKLNQKTVPTVIYNAIKRNYEIDWDIPISFLVPDDYLKGSSSESFPAAILIPINPLTMRLSDSRQLHTMDGNYDLPLKSVPLSMSQAEYVELKWFDTMENFGDAFRSIYEYVENEDLDTCNYSFVSFYTSEFFGTAVNNDINFMRIFKRIR